MRKALLTALIALILAFSLAPIAGAQDDMTLCYNYSEADCAALTSAFDNMNNISSATMTVSGSFAVGGTEMLDPTLAGLEGTFEVTGGFDLGTDAFALDLNASGNFGEGPDEMVLGFRVVDGVVYMTNVDTGAWEGASIADGIASGEIEAEQVQQVLDAANLGELFGLLTDVATEGAGSLGALAGAGAAGAGDMQDLAMLPGFITQTRLADEDMMGQAMSPFSTDIDFSVLLADAEFQEMIGAFAALAGGGLGGDGGAETAQMAMLIPMLLQGIEATANYTIWVGADDNFVHRMTFDFNASLDLGALFGAAGGGDSDVQLPPVTVVAGLVFDLGGINGGFSTEAPAGATMIDPSG